MLLMNLTDEENLSLLIDAGFVRFLYIAMFEPVSVITSQTAEQCMLFHINSFRPLFRLTVSRMVFFISIYKVNKLFRVKVLRPIYRRYQDKINVRIR